LGLLTCKIVSQITYTVLVETPCSINQLREVTSSWPSKGRHNISMRNIQQPKR